MLHLGLAGAVVVAGGACVERKPSAEETHQSFSALRGERVDLVLEDGAIHPLEVVETTEKKVMVAKGVGEFVSFSVLFVGQPLAKAPRVPLPLRGRGLPRQDIFVSQVDRPRADGTVYYQAVFNIRRA
ncbi:MAG: hypothetical protein AB2A00_08475 [Myxococcota bacterium]